MDRVVNIAQPTCDCIDEHLQERHDEEMQDLMGEYTRQIQEIARARDLAVAETTRIAAEREAAKAARDAELQRIKETQQTLKDTMAQLKQAKRTRREEEKTWEKERSKLERRSKTWEDKLALAISSMEKRLRQAERRAEDEYMDKEEVKRLNEELIERNHRDERDALETKASQEQWRRKYSTALAEKIDLVHQYAVSSHTSD
jgi:hypothetical protein